MRRAKAHGIQKHLPRHAVALAVLVAEVAHLRAHDVHARLAHGVLRAPVAGQRVVRDDFGNSADVGAAVGLVLVVVVVDGVPSEHLLMRPAGG